MTSLQFITHATEQYTYFESAQVALEGGCRWIQLRMKNSSLEVMQHTALQVQELCKSYQATFILDDQVELAKRIGADGVHLGLNDTPIAEARHYLGADFIIGATVNQFAELQQHEKNGADYIGCGPFRYTSTKKLLSPLLGLEGYQKILHAMKKHHCPLPLVAIGGIQSSDILELKSIGISHIAVSGGILNASDPQKETQTILNLLQ